MSSRHWYVTAAHVRPPSVERTSSPASVMAKPWLASVKPMYVARARFVPSPPDEGVSAPVESSRASPDAVVTTACVSSMAPTTCLLASPATGTVCHVVPRSVVRRTLSAVPVGQVSHTEFSPEEMDASPSEGSHPETGFGAAVFPPLPYEAETTALDVRQTTTALSPWTASWTLSGPGVVMSGSVATSAHGAVPTWPHRWIP